MNLSMFWFNYTLDKFHIENIELNTDQTGIDMTKGDIVVSLANFSLKWVGKVKFSTDPVLFFGDGDGWFNLTNLNVTMKLNFDIGPNMLPRLKLIQSNVAISNKSISMGFNGSNDIFQVMNMTQAFALPMILDIIQGEMKAETIKMLEETINGVLGSLPHEITIPTTDIAFDYGFIFSPKVNEKGYVSAPIKGSAKCVNESRCVPYEKKPVPPKKEDFTYGDGSLQIHLSDYIINSFSVAAFEDSLLKYVITPEMVHNLTGGLIELNTKLYGIFIPEIARKYGPDGPITIKLTSLSPPEVSIDTKFMKGKKNLL